MFNPDLVPQKPKFGSPCNGCGLCCATEICAIGKEAFGDIEGPCPAIKWVDDKFRCGIVMAEQILQTMNADTFPIVQDFLGVGQGCCADDIIDDGGVANA